MRCAKCQTTNPDTYRFCTQCGAKLGNSCPKCGAGNPPQYRFCNACGHELVVVPKPETKALSLEEKLVGPEARSKRFDVSTERGVNPFVGKERELELMMDAEEYKASCRDDISLEDLDKNPKKFKGMKVKYRGEIVHIIENEGQTDIIASVVKDKHHWEGTILIWYDGTTKAVENDIILTWGELRGNYTYASVLGWKINLPLVRAKYVNVIQSVKQKG